jgi:hypothetical protein
MKDQSSPVKHYVMAGIALVGLVCLTLAHVWRVVGIGQAVFMYALLAVSGIRDFRKGRQP